MAGTKGNGRASRAALSAFGYAVTSQAALDNALSRARAEGRDQERRLRENFAQKYRDSLVSIVTDQFVNVAAKDRQLEIANEMLEGMNLLRVSHKMSPRTFGRAAIDSAQRAGLEIEAVRVVHSAGVTALASARTEVEAVDLLD